MISKSELLAEVRQRLGLQLEAVEKALADSQAAATDPGSKAEGKYDTRSLEMSYLVNGQDRQAAELRESVRALESFEPRDFTLTESIRMGALVELNRHGEWEHYFLIPAGGGIALVFGDTEITTLSPESPLFGRLENQRVGEELADNLRITELS